MSAPLEEFDLLSLADAAELLRCSKAHVSKAVSGRIPGCAAIPCVTLGRRKLIRRSSLLAWLAANDKVARNDNRKPVGQVRIVGSPEAGRRSA
jgi:hypothetical protein